MNETEQPGQVETIETLKALGIILKQLSETAYVLEDDQRELHIDVVTDSALRVDFFVDDHQKRPQGKVRVKTFSKKTPEKNVVFSAEDGKLVIKSHPLTTK